MLSTGTIEGKKDDESEDIKQTKKGRNKQTLLVIAAVTFHRRLLTRNTALPLPRERWFGSLAASTNLMGSEGAGGRAEE